jgi:exonuclease III
VLPSQVLFDFEGEDPHLSEGRVITLYFEDCVVIGVYSPATIADDDLTRVQFDHKLIQHVRQLRTINQLPVLVLGDLNVPPAPEDVSVGTPWLPRPRTFISERKAFQQLLEAGSFQDSTSSCGLTWHPEPHRYYQGIGIGQRLDLILLPHQWKVLSRKIRHFDTYSDHRPVIVEFSTSLSHPTPQYGLQKMMAIGNGLDFSLFLNQAIRKLKNKKAANSLHYFICS